MWEYLGSKDHELELLLLMFLAVPTLLRRGDIEEFRALVEGICVVEEFLTKDYVAGQVLDDVKEYM